MATQQLSLDFKAGIATAKPALFHSHSPLPWIQVAPQAPYFITDDGKPWLPIGQNDAITWPDLSGAFRGKNVPEVEIYLAYLVENRINCIRLMLEYCQTDNRYLERPAGQFQPNMISLWDNLFALCEKYKLRILLTPFDTFWMRKRWKRHPYNRFNDGPCASKTQWLVCKKTLELIKGRLAFVTKRWGMSGVIFAWDLWNEPDLLHANKSSKNITDFITTISLYLRQLETDLYGRAHLQTVSAFAPHLQKHQELTDIFFRHPTLDFATLHMYDAQTIDHPKNTVSAALHTGALVAKALSEIKDNRPFFDSEHGPIRTFRKRSGNLPEAFDNEYFHHIQWAHLASGGAGGGMRWPYRHPHRLTNGMRKAQKSLAGFVELVNWLSFQRKNLSLHVKCKTKGLKVFACGDEDQVIMWLLRKDLLTKAGMLEARPESIGVRLQLPAISKGLYTIYFWDTLGGKILYSCHTEVKPGKAFILSFTMFSADVALLVNPTIPNIAALA